MVCESNPPIYKPTNNINQSIYLSQSIYQSGKQARTQSNEATDTTDDDELQTNAKRKQTNDGRTTDERTTNERRTNDERTNERTNDERTNDERSHKRARIRNPDDDNPLNIIKGNHF